MNNQSQILRLIRILQILSTGRKVTTKQLRERFDYQISIRTVQRDLLTLTDAGVPLVCNKLSANENVWFLESRFRSFIPQPVTKNEYLAAYVLRSNLKVFHNTQFDSEIQTLIKKIDQLVPDNVFLEMNHKFAQGLFENYSAGEFDYSPYSQIIDSLVNATTNQNICRIIYSGLDSTKPKSYDIEPEKLVYYNGGLYIIALMRFYRRFILLSVQRIRELEIKEKKFVKDIHFNSQEFWKGRFGLFPGERRKVVLRFSREVTSYIEGRKWHDSQSVVFDDDQNFILTMKVALSPELISWIMSWHIYVKVLKPIELIRSIKSAAEGIVEQY